MIEIKINDRSWWPDKSMSKAFVPSFFTWYRGQNSHSKDNNICFFTDLCAQMIEYPEYRLTKNVMLIVEPPVINPNIYDYIYRNHHRFDYILSHIDSFVKNIPNGHYFANAMSHIEKEGWRIWPKSRTVNIVASNKNYAPGHKLRHALINSVGMDKMDVLGGATGHFIKDKLDTLKDYKFSVAIENCQMDSYFSEKIIDCFATGTIPIYWGPSTIGKFFNPNGILACNTLAELQRTVYIINKSGDNMYEKMLPAAKENFEIAKNYSCGEDWLYTNFLQKHNLL